MKVPRPSPATKDARQDPSFPTFSTLSVLLRYPRGSKSFANRPPDHRGRGTPLPCFVAGAGSAVQGKRRVHQPKFSSTHPIVGKFLRNVRIHRLGIGYVHCAFGNRAVALLGKAASVQRGSQSRIDPEGGVKIG